MADPDKFQSISSVPKPEKHNPLATHLPDIAAIAIMGTLLVLPSEILHHYYQDDLKYIKEAQSGLLMVKTALASQIPSLAAITFVVYARLTKDREFRRK